MFKRIWLFLVFLPIMGAILFAVYIYPGLSPIPEEQIQMAEMGVSENASWQPIMRRIKGEELDPEYATSVIGFRCARDFSP